MGRWLLSFAIVCIFLGFCKINASDDGAEDMDEFRPVLTKAITDKLFFYETFDEGDPFESGKWVKSGDEKFANQPVTIRVAKSPTKGYEDDKGLQLTESMKHYGFVAPFPKPLDTKGKDLVIQYDLKLEETLACGGAYVKLPRAQENLDLAAFNSDTPYSIMFGPDKCGSSNNKVHFILQHENPKTHIWEEKHFNDTPTVKMDKKTHLYTLHIKNADDTFALYIDKKLAKSGSLFSHMRPPIQPAEFLDDPNDVKPSDWINDPKIEDPDAVKPDDWDESAPKMIPDPKAVKPANWQDDAPQKIADPTATKPEDWDDEEDGEWEAPQIQNPLCAKNGCGKWIPPNVKNPAYKGKWRAPRINNPAYQGPWQPKKIQNPDYFQVKSPADNIPPMAGLAVEVWTTTGSILFNNFCIAHSLEDAFSFADVTFTHKSDVEKKKDKKSEKKKREKKKKITAEQNRKKAEKVAAEKNKKAGKSSPAGASKGPSVSGISATAMQIIASIKANPWPFTTAVLAIILVIVLTSKGPSGSSRRPPQAQAQPQAQPQTQPQTQTQKISRAPETKETNGEDEQKLRKVSSTDSTESRRSSRLKK